MAYPQYQQPQQDVVPETNIIMRSQTLVLPIKRSNNKDNSLKSRNIRLLSCEKELLFWKAGQCSSDTVRLGTPSTTSQSKMPLRSSIS
ncbi:hypothetical protein E4T56_gene6597 [Termitomyces sp. T112]|nr:hypothetical protein E4T56_gene6597 [Termitomyces sp. T112]